MSKEQTKPRKGCIRGIFGFFYGLFKWTVILCLLAGVGYFTWQQYRGELALKQINSALAQPHLFVPEYEMLPPEQDATRFWLAAMEIAGESLHLDYDNFDWPEYGVRIDPKASAEFAKCVKANQAALPLISEARSRPFSDFGFTLPDDFYPHLSFTVKTRQLARALEAQVYYGISIGNAQMAVNACKDNLAWCKALAHLKTRTAQPVRVSIVHLAISDIEDILGCLELDHEQLAELAGEMKDGLPVDFTGLCENELLLCQAVARHPEWQLLIPRHLTANARMVFKLRKKYPFTETQFYPGTRENIPEEEMWWDRLGKSILYSFEDLTVAQYQISSLEFVEFYLAMLDAMPDGELSWSGHQEIMKQYPVGKENGFEMLFRASSKWATCHAALLIEQYRVKQGHWPAILTEVFDEIPLDAYGQPLKIIRTEDGLWVYSIGADGIDHKGLGRWQDGSLKDKDDITFRLLNVGKRNQEPKPKPEPAATDDKPANMFE